METIVTVSLFLQLVFSIPFTIAVLKGLKYVPEDPNCPEEVKSVKLNILGIKISAVVTLITGLIAIIFTQF